MSRRVLVCVVSLLAALTATAPAAARATASPAACERRVTVALTDARTTGGFTQTSIYPDTWTSTDLGVNARVEGLRFDDVAGPTATAAATAPPAPTS